MASKIIISLSYILVIIGSVGMILFSTKFPFSTRIKDLSLTNHRLLGLDGFQVWIGSWSCIILGTLIQLINYWVSLSSQGEIVIKF
jgi:hypothetical protein